MLHISHSSLKGTMLLFLRRYPLYVFIAVQFSLVMLWLTTNHRNLTRLGDHERQFEWTSPEKFVTSERGTKLVPYDNKLPLIFIGGMPRSGTTLLRVLLDAHPQIRCGEETRVIPRILSYRQTWLKSAFEAKRLEHAGITSAVLDSAISSFILEIIVKHGKPAPRLCNKDPFTIRSAVYLQSIFPNAKFIFMIRDGRAVVHSIISRKVTISGFDLSDFRQCLKKWNSAMDAMYKQCRILGTNICLPVIYEQLVLHPKKTLTRILNFLNVPWNDTVLHHEKVIEKGDISLSKLERSTDQVVKPINLEALSKWVGHVPSDVAADIREIAPMLGTFGYDFDCNSANYGQPDQDIKAKLEGLSEEEKRKFKEREEEAIRTRERLREEIMNNSPKQEEENSHDSNDHIAH